jgi:hypothetical protein
MYATYMTKIRLVVFAILVWWGNISTAQQDKPPALTELGKTIEVHYTQIFESIQSEVSEKLPDLASQKIATFDNARAELASLAAPKEGSSPEAYKAYETAKTEAELKAFTAARALFADVDSLLADGALDSKFIKAAIIRHATPRGLAEFAQQGDTERDLLRKLFADEELMLQVLLAGGANGGEYGEAMQTYAAILAASEQAGKAGILQRLALGTALHQPWLAGKEKGGVYGIVYTDHQTPDGQVARYLHYEKAYLAGELDSAFKDMNAWECRFITSDPYSNQELAWTREMLRTYRPDHIANDDQRWRYTRFVKSDVPYQTPKFDDALGTRTQQIVACGGKCGPRAFYGRTLTRAFGIPARRSTQTGHAAMSRWTPDGWAICFGAWWSSAWCGPQGGLDFLLDSQAREHENAYMEVLRAKWIGDALGEEDVSIRQYGKGGGFWDSLAFYKKRAIVEDAKVETVELAGGMKLGESDELLGDEQSEAIKIPEEDKKIIVDGNGIITVPAVACTFPQNNTDKIAFLNSWGDEGMQLHYQRLGNRPEILRYTVQSPVAGKYEITAKIATVSVQQTVILRLNRRAFVNLSLPYTKGLWKQTDPKIIELREGSNSFMFTLRAPNRGVSIKEFQLKPMK